MTIFGQLVIGPPGSGKSTYCYEMQKYLKKIGRKVVVLNLDPANDLLPYTADIDVGDIVTAEDVMTYTHVGPNCALLNSMEFIEENVEVLCDQIKKLSDHYILIDCPGQVELYTNHESLKNILKNFSKLDLRLCCVHLVDSHYCSDGGKFISTLLLSLCAMLHMEMPHVNILSKIDLWKKFSDKIDFGLDFYTDVLDLSHLIESLDNSPFTSRFKKLNRILSSFVEDYSLVYFLPLNSKDEGCLRKVQQAVDKANGYIFGTDKERDIQRMLSVAMALPDEQDYDPIDGKVA